jgi:beta-glucosidase-like glycosyl hydrolase
VQWLLRQQLGFDGLIVTDALSMNGVLEGRSEGEAAVEALNSGCDVVLQPADLEATVEALRRARAQHDLLEENVRNSLRRRLKWAQWASPPNEWRKPAAADVAWGHRLADRVIRMVRGVRPPMKQPLDVLVIDDDTGPATSAAAREPFVRTLREAGWDARRVDAATHHMEPAQPRRSSIIALFGEGNGPSRRSGYSEATRAAVERAAEQAPGALLLQFGHPRLIRDLPPGPPIATAWGGESAMQQAAARWLAAGD